MDSASESGAADSRSEESAAAGLARRYLASFADRDPASIARHVTVDFVNDHAAALGSGSVGREDYEARLRGFLDDMVDLRYEIEGLVDDGAQVAAFYRMTALWLGRTPFSIRGVQRLEMRDGLIARRTDYWDSAVFLRQVSAEARDALAPFGID